MNNEDKLRLKNLQHNVMWGFSLIIKIARALPVPVELAPPNGEGWEADEAIAQVDRLRQILLADQPLEAEVIDMITELLLDWYALGDLVAMAYSYGPNKFRVDAGLRLSQRIIKAGDDIAEKFGVHRF